MAIPTTGLSASLTEPAEGGKAPSQTRLVFTRLRADIVAGRLMPGTKLNIAALADEIGVSAGAVREALASLEAEALVISEPARGFRVSPVSAKELTDLTAARIEVEKLCFTDAIRNGDLEWEGRIVSAFHRLSRVPERVADAQEVNPEWADFHAGFHHALISGCTNRWLMRLHELLYQQSERYRQLSVPLATVRPDLQSEHRELMTAVLNRDVQAAHDLITAHLNTTARLILASPKLAQSAV